VIVGSCPKSAADVNRIADESPATAILCLQARTHTFHSRAAHFIRLRRA
jgi:hypothetical protein